MKLTIGALLLACIVGDVSGYCYTGYNACYSACAAPCVLDSYSCYTCGAAYAVAPVVEHVAVAPAVAYVGSSCATYVGYGYCDTRASYMAISCAGSCAFYKKK